MRIGEIFQRDQAFWMVAEVTPEQNQRFTWLKVLAKGAASALCLCGPMKTERSTWTEDAKAPEHS